MEKYSKSTKNFISSLSKDLEKETKNPERGIRDAIRLIRLLKNRERIPQAIMAYELSKNAEYMAEDIDALKLKNFLVDNYQADWIGWAPETIRKTLLEDVPNEVIENKIQALAVCLRTDTPWLEWHIFENVGKCFNHQVPNFGVLQPLSVGECAVTMYTMRKLRPEEEFSEEVLIYVAARAAEENYVYLPDEFEVGASQKILDSFTYDPWLKEAVKDRWEKIRSSDKLAQVSIKETPAEIQLGKLILLKQYFKENTEE